MVVVVVVVVVVVGGGSKSGQLHLGKSEQRTLLR